MKSAILVITLILLFGPPANAGILTFDNLALGDYGDNLIYGDVTIRAYPGSHLQVTDPTSDGFGKAHSLPNKLSVWGEEPLVPKEKTSFLVIFNSPVQNLNFWLTGTFHDTTINAYDLNNNLVETFVQTYPMEGPVAPDGRPWDYYYDDVLRHVYLQEDSIARITIQPSAYDGFSIDDLSYTVEPVVPEPATLLLFGTGLVGVFSRRSR